MGELDDYLAGTQAAGQRDSSGAFTLALAEAARKLGRHQLAGPAWALLKVIQAGVGWEATELALEESGDGLWLHCRGDSLDFTDDSWLADFERRLVSAEDGPDTDFLIGLNVLLQVATRLALIRWSHGRPEKRVQLLGESGSLARFPWSAGSSLQVQGKLGAVQELLSQRLTFLARPVTWNGKPLRHPWPFPTRSFWESHQEGLSIYLDLSWACLDRGANVKDLPEKPIPALGFPLKRGVLLDEFELPSPGGVAVVFGADALPVDLGQFRLSQGPEWQRYWPKLLASLRAAVEEASQDEASINRLLHADSDLAGGTIPLVHTLLGSGLVVGGLLHLNPVSVILGGIFAGMGGWSLTHSWSRLRRRASRRAEIVRELRQIWEQTQTR